MPHTCRVICPECSARLRYDESAERSNRLMQCPHCTTAFIASFQAIAATPAVGTLQSKGNSQVISLNQDSTSWTSSSRSSDPVSLPAYVSSTPTPIRPAQKPWLKNVARILGMSAAVLLLGAGVWYLISGPIRSLASNLPGIPSLAIMQDTPERVREAFWSVVRRHRSELDPYHELASTGNEAIQQFRFSESLRAGVEDCFIRALFLEDKRPMKELIQFSKNDTEQNTREGIARYYVSKERAKAESQDRKPPTTSVRYKDNFEVEAVFRLEERILELLKGGTGVLPSPENPTEEALKPELAHRRKLVQRLSKCLKQKSVSGAAEDIRVLANAFEAEAKQYRTPPFARVAEEYHLADGVWRNSEIMLLILIERRFDPGDEFRDAVYAYECVGQKHCAGKGVGDYYADHGLVHGDQRYVTPEERAKAIADKANEEEEARKFAERKAAREKAEAEEKIKREAAAAAEAKARRERDEAFAKERQARMDNLQAQIAEMDRSVANLPRNGQPGMRQENFGNSKPNASPPVNGAPPDFARRAGPPYGPGMPAPNFPPFGPGGPFGPNNPNSSGMPGLSGPKGPLTALPPEKLLVVEFQSKSSSDFQTIVKRIAEKLETRRYQFSSSGKEAKTVIIRFAYDESIEEAQAKLGAMVVKADDATRTLTVDANKVIEAP